MNHNTPSVCRLSKRRISIIFGTAWCVKLKLVGLVVRDFELTKDDICIVLLLHTAVTIIATTTTATKSKANTIISTAATITVGTSVTKAKSIKAKNLWNI